MWNMIWIWTLFVIVFLIVLKIICKLTNAVCHCTTCLIGKTALITGGSSGIGYKTALALAARGCRVIIASRSNSQQHADNIKATTNNSNILVKHLNLASFESVRAFADELLATEERLDILINNAGVVGTGNVFTDDGLQTVMQTNHFGPFLLTKLLLPLIKKSAPSRIIFISSILAFTNDLSTSTATKMCQPYKDHSEANSVWKDFRIYSNSKLCNVIAARYFAKQLEGSRVTSNALHPGAVNTGIFRLALEQHTTNFWIVTFYALFGFLFKNVNEGIQTILHLALSREVENVSGKLFLESFPIFLPRAARNRHICETVISETLDITKLSAEGSSNNVI